MNKIEQELKSLFSNSIEPLKVSLFCSNNEYDDFLCSFSNCSKYKTGEKKSLYELNPLIRVLSLKTQILSNTLINRVYLEEDKTLCFILEWKNYAKKIFLFDIENLVVFEDKEFTETLDNNKNMLFNIFQTSLSNLQEENGSI